MTQSTLELEIRGRRIEAPGVVSLDLRWPDDAPLPPFEAGAHVDIHLPSSATRQYSLWNDPVERHRYCIAVRLDDNGRGGSREVHGLTENQRLRVGLPRNLFRLVPGARHTVLIAAGIGITPLFAMAQQLARTGASFELHYRARDLMPAFWSAIQAADWADRAHLHAGDRSSFDPGALVRGHTEGSQLYVCGPLGFAEACRSALRWPPEALHQETFLPAAPLAHDGSFEVELARTGVTLTIPADRSILEVVGEHGVYLPTSCEQGICGTCRTRVLAGTPDHRDLVLTASEQASNQFITPCCSRALSSRLVLDL